jgi:hypothetical protein
MLTFEKVRQACDNDADMLQSKYKHTSKRDLQSCVNVTMMLTCYNQSTNTERAGAALVCARRLSCAWSSFFPSILGLFCLYSRSLLLASR